MWGCSVHQIISRIDMIELENTDTGKSAGIKPHAEKWYESKTPPVVEGDDITILWDLPINTDRAIQANRPGIQTTRTKHASLLTWWFLQIEIFLYSSK